jgi:hypothetical protein
MGIGPWAVEGLQWDFKGWMCPGSSFLHTFLRHQCVSKRGWVDMSVPGRPLAPILEMHWVIFPPGFWVLGLLRHPLASPHFENALGHLGSPRKPLLNHSGNHRNLLESQCPLLDSWVSEAPVHVQNGGGYVSTWAPLSHPILEMHWVIVPPGSLDF